MEIISHFSNAASGRTFRAATTSAVVGQDGGKGGNPQFQRTPERVRRCFTCPAGFKDHRGPPTKDTRTNDPVAKGDRRGGLRRQPISHSRSGARRRLSLRGTRAERETACAQSNLAQLLSMIRLVRPTRNASERDVRRFSPTTQVLLRLRRMRCGITTPASVTRETHRVRIRLIRTSAPGDSMTGDSPPAPATPTADEISRSGCSPTTTTIVH